MTAREVALASPLLRDVLWLPLLPDLEAEVELHRDAEMTDPGRAGGRESRKLSDLASARSSIATLLGGENDEAIYRWAAEESDGEGGPASEEVAAHSVRETAMSARTLLVAEDDELVRSTIVSIMEDAGYFVIEVSDGEEALAFLERGHTEIAALVSDIRIPRLNGLDLARVTASRWPDLAIVLVSGYSAGGRLTASPEGAVFVAKPFRPEELVEAVGRAITFKGAH